MAARNRLLRLVIPRVGCLAARDADAACCLLRHAAEPVVKLRRARINASRLGAVSMHGSVQNLVLGRLGRVELGDDAPRTGHQNAVRDRQDFRQIG
jgi:hypothetical protein